MPKEPKNPQMKPETPESDPDATYKRLEEIAKKVLSVPKDKADKRSSPQLPNP